MVVTDRIEAHAKPCGDKAVVALLAPMVAVYGVADRSKAEWAAFWRLYIAALADLPLSALRTGVDDYVAQPDSEFFPKPGPLKALCEKHAIPLRMAANRARKALEKAS